MLLIQRNPHSHVNKGAAVRGLLEGWRKMASKRRTEHMCKAATGTACYSGEVNHILSDEFAPDMILAH